MIEELRVAEEEILQRNEELLHDITEREHREERIAKLSRSMRC